MDLLAVCADQLRTFHFVSCCFYFMYSRVGWIFSLFVIPILGSSVFHYHYAVFMGRITRSKFQSVYFCFCAIPFTE